MTLEYYVEIVADDKILCQEATNSGEQEIVSSMTMPAQLRE